MQQKKQKQTFGREKEINLLNEYILFVPNTMDLIVSLCFCEYSIVEKFLRFYTSLCGGIFIHMFYADRFNDAKISVHTPSTP